MANNKKNENALANLVINILIPTVILMKLSTPKYLGPVYGLVVALAFPLLYGAYDLKKRSKVNFFSAIGLINILLTGGIGLLKLDREAMIIKEAAVPALMGIGVLIAQLIKKPFILLFLEEMLNFKLVFEEFAKRGKEELINKRLSVSNNLLGLTFFVSSYLNYVLAEKILVGNPGSEVYNQSLGKMNLLSIPVISIPMMVMVGFIIWQILKLIKTETKLELEDILKT